MKIAWALGGLITIVTVILALSRHPSWQRVLHWLPVPLWCYALPMIAVACGWLPHEQASHSLYRPLTDQLLPVALGLLLLGVDLPAIIRVGGRALLAAAIGAFGIVVGTPMGVWLLRSNLPLEAWKGAGALAGTWTGGTMNLLSLRTVLGTPDSIFAPLIAVDAIMAYSWMALLVVASGFQNQINRWLSAADSLHTSHSTASAHESAPGGWPSAIVAAFLALGLASGARMVAMHLPTSQFINSSSGWAVLFVTSVALGLSLIPTLRRIGASGSRLGYPCLYLVLAATGAQASVSGLWSAPAWLLVGVVAVIVHGGVLLLAGRLFRMSFGMLATASQANIGGLVSAPMVGAVYSQDLAPIGLLLAIAENAVGTYLGLLAALLARLLTG